MPSFPQRRDDGYFFGPSVRTPPLAFTSIPPARPTFRLITGLGRKCMASTATPFSPIPSPSRYYSGVAVTFDKPISGSITFDVIADSTTPELEQYHHGGRRWTITIGGGSDDRRPDAPLATKSRTSPFHGPSHQRGEVDRHRLDLPSLSSFATSGVSNSPLTFQPHCLRAHRAARDRPFPEPGSLARSSAVIAGSGSASAPGGGAEDGVLSNVRTREVRGLNGCTNCISF